MQPKSPKLLEDIRDGASFVREVTQGRTLDDYSKDRLLRQAVERNFEIIGEAVRRLAQHDPQTAERIGDYQRIISFRNILIHGYDLVNHALVWSTIENELVLLLDQVERLIVDVSTAKRVPGT